MLKITLHESSRELRFQLEGKLSGPWVREFEQCWQRSPTHERGAMVDLRDVDFIDPEGQQLLAEMHRRGVRLVASTPLIRSLVEEVCGDSCCGTVEEKRAHAHDVFLRSPHTTGPDSRAL